MEYEEFSLNIIDSLKKQLKHKDSEIKRLRKALETVRDTAWCSSPPTQYMMSHCELPYDFEPWEYFWNKERRPECGAIANDAVNT